MNEHVMYARIKYHERVSGRVSAEIIQYGAFVSLPEVHMHHDNDWPLEGK